MSEKMRSYASARTLYSFLEFLGWSVVLLGLVVGLMLVSSAGRYASDSQKFLLFLMGGGGSLVGLFLVASVQNWRAGVDSAEYGQQMLKIARDQLAVSQQGVKQSVTTPQSFASVQTDQGQDAPTNIKRKAASSKPKPASEPARTIEYGGKEILIENGKYTCNGIPFSSLEKAQGYVDQFATAQISSPDKTPSAT